MNSFNAITMQTVSDIISDWDTFYTRNREGMESEWQEWLEPETTSEGVPQCLDFSGPGISAFIPAPTTEAM